MFAKLLRCRSKFKKLKKQEGEDLTSRLENALQENQRLNQKVDALIKTVDELHLAKNDLEAKLKESESFDNQITEMNQVIIELRQANLELEMRVQELTKCTSSNVSEAGVEIARRGLSFEESDHINDLNQTVISDDKENTEVCIDKSDSFDEEDSDILSELGTFSKKDPLSIRKMPTPLKKPPTQISIRTYEKLFDPRTGRLRSNKSTQALIEKLRHHEVADLCETFVNCHYEAKRQLVKCVDHLQFNHQDFSQECYKGLQTVLHESFMFLADEFKKETTECLGKIEPPAFQLGQHQIEECCLKKSLLLPNLFVTINSTASCYAVYKRSLENCNILSGCCPAYQHCEMSIEILHGLEHQESSIFEYFNCPKTSKMNQTSREFRRAQTKSSPQSETTFHTTPATVTSWTLPTLLPLPSLPTLPPPEKVFNDLANFFFPRMKVNNTSLTSTITDKPQTVTSSPTTAAAKMFEMARTIRMNPAIEELIRRRKQKRNQMKHDRKSKISPDGPIIIVDPFNKFGHREDSHKEAMQDGEKHNSATIMNASTSNLASDSLLSTKKSTTPDTTTSSVFVMELSTTSNITKTESSTLSSIENSTNAPKTEPMIIPSTILEFKSTFPANAINMTSHSHYCTQALECSSAMNLLYSFCDKHYAPSTSIIIYEIPDHELREIFLHNSKTVHSSIKQKCLQVVDSESQQQLIELRSSIIKRNLECVQNVSVIEKLPKEKESSCENISLFSDVVALLKDSMSKEGMTIFGCYDHVTKMEENCKALKECCPSLVKCEKESSQEKINYEEIISQLKEEQKLCENRRKLTLTKAEIQIKKKKDIRDFTDADLERLYEEWEENDDEPLPYDEKPEHLRPKPKVSLDDLKKQAKSPEDLLRLSKKGQPIMMFVSVVDPDSKTKPNKRFTDGITTRWQSNLYNNHIDAQVYVIEDDRALFMFKEGSQAWEAKDFLLKQPECAEITLEGQTLKGHASDQKNEL